MAETEWTLERIYAALGNDPEINKLILSQINGAAEGRLTAVFAYWRKRAEETANAVDRGREADATGSLWAEPGLIEHTIDDLQARAERLRAAAA